MVLSFLIENGTSAAHRLTFLGSHYGETGRGRQVPIMDGGHDQGSRSRTDQLSGILHLLRHLAPSHVGVTSFRQAGDAQTVEEAFLLHEEFRVGRLCMGAQSTNRR